MTKWFFEIQKNADERLRQDYDRIENLKQDVLKDRVYELKMCIKHSKPIPFGYYPGKNDVILVVMSRESGRYQLFRLFEK